MVARAPQVEGLRIVSGSKEESWTSHKVGQSRTATGQCASALIPSACPSHDVRSDFDSVSLNSWLVKYHLCSFGPRTALKYSSAELWLMYMSCCAHWK